MPQDDTSVVVPLTRGKVAIIDAEDVDRVLAFRWCALFANGQWYAGRHVHRRGWGQMILLHRFILDNPSCARIDHIDGDGLNCRKSNMRQATPSQNGMNRGLQKNNTSGYKGVSWIKGRQMWRATIKHEGKVVTIGTFADKETAARAYDAKALELCGAFAWLNFPDGAA